MNCRITAMRKAAYPDLSMRYENTIDAPCPVKEGQIFLSCGGAKPDGLCQSAWETMHPFVEELCRGGGNFYDG